MALDPNTLLQSGDVQGAALAAGMTLDDVQRLRSAVSNPADFASAVSGYINLDSNQVAAVRALAQKDYGGALKAISPLLGNSASTSDLLAAGESLLSGDLLGAIGPLVAGALLAANVAAPVVAAIGGAIALGEQALEALGVLKSGQSQCDWQVGSHCFTGDRPFGPEDPNWVPFAVYWQEAISPPSALFGGQSTGLFAGDAYPLVSLDPYAATVVDELRALEKGGTVNQSSPMTSDRSLDAFRMAFCRAYLANLEKAINGHPFSKAADLLNQVAYAWNSSHAGSSATIVGDAAPPQAVTLSGVMKPSIVEMILRGDVDRIRREPLVIVTGPTPASVFRAAIRLPQLGAKKVANTIQLRGVQEFVQKVNPATAAGKAFISALTPPQQAVIEAHTLATAAKAAPASGVAAPLFTVGKVQVTKGQAIGAGVIGAALVALRAVL